MIPVREIRWIKPAVYGISVPSGIAGAVSIGASALAVAPVMIGATAGVAVGWWVNQLISNRLKR